MREKIPTYSIPTLRRWRKYFGRGGLTALAPRYGNRLGDGIIDQNPAIRDFVIGMIGRWPTHVRPYRILRAMRAAFPEARLPSRSALRDWINRWVAANRAVFAATANPRGFKNSFKVSFGLADAEVAGVPNALWEIDTTVGDMFLLDEDGRLRRFCILGVIDVGIKRVRFFVIRSESSADVRRALCQLILEWGVPSRLRGDNGSGYVAEQTQRFCRDLGIQYEACDPFSPWQKPHIERAFRTLQHDYFEILPSFAGHDVRGAQALREQESFAARFGRSKEIAAKHALRPEELQRGIDAWCVAYAERNGATLRLSEWSGDLRRISDQRALELLVEDGEARTLNKTGIFFRGARFIAVEFADHIGERALVFADPHGDLGKLYVFVEQRQGRKFLCVAESVERLGINRNDTAILAKLAQARFINSKKAEIRRAKRRITPELVAAAMTEVGTRSSSISQESLADEVAHQTQEWTAASDALGAHSIQSSITSDDVREANAQAARYRELRRRPERELPAADRRWIAWFETSPVFKAYSMADEAAVA